MRVSSIWRRYRLSLLSIAVCITAVVLFNLRAVTALPITSSSSVNLPDLQLTQDVKKTVLDNGLTVLTKEVHTAPVVDVRVWYNIGSTDEAPGENGIAHLLEHMMFKGTTDRPIQFGRLLQAVAGFFNAATHYEFTAYIDRGESANLEALLTLEADRMQNAILDPQDLESEKQVVISELQGYENDPTFRLNTAVMKAVFPNSMYGLPVGGNANDVRQFTPDQVRAYYSKYYSPENATLVLVGDFDTDPTLDIINRTFGQVPRGDRTAAVGNQSSGATNASPSNNPSRDRSPIVLREAGSVAMLEQVYRTPDINHPDVVAIDLMNAILTEGRSSRLYQALVETGLVSDLYGGQANLVDAGWYQLFAIAPPDQAMQEVEQTIANEIQRLQTEGVTQDELDRAKRQLLSDLVLLNRGIDGQAEIIGVYHILTGDYRRLDRDLAAIANVTREDVQRVAKTYLRNENQITGRFEPTQQADQPLGAAGSLSQTTESFATGEPVDPAEVAQYLPPVNTNTVSNEQSLPESFKLANGLTVLLLPDSSTPTATLTGAIRAGREYDAIETAGLADLTAANLINGTRTRDAAEIALALEEKGASLSFEPHREGVNVQGYSLANDLPTLLEIFADVVQNAQFPEDWLNLTRQQALSNLALDLDSPGALANRVFQQTAYPAPHPLYAFATQESLTRITRNNVQQFYQLHYQPEAIVLTLKGDFDPAQVRSLLESQLGNWQARGAASKVEYPSAPLPAETKRLNPVIPGKFEAVTIMGHPQVLDRNDPRFYAAQVLNQVLGGSGTLSSRLGTEIRDRQGLTYGIYSDIGARIHPGPFSIQMQTAPENTQRAIASTIAILKQVQQSGVTPDEVETAKQAITNEYTVSLADPDVLSSLIVFNHVAELDPDELRQFTEKIQAVTVDEVNQAAAELLHPDQLVIVTAGPNISNGQ